jgi:hypothetical protein
LLSKGTANRHERNIFTATFALQKRRGILYVVHAEVLQAGKVTELDEKGYAGSQLVS